MPLRPLPYHEVKRKWEAAGFTEVNQKGSHVKFAKRTSALGYGGMRKMRPFLVPLPFLIVQAEDQTRYLIALLSHCRITVNESPRDRCRRLHRLAGL